MKKTLLSASIAVLAFGASQAQAFSVGGVEFSLGNMQAQTSVFEEPGDFSIGSTVSGVGEIGIIDGQVPSEFCVSGACEVTFYFYDYVLVDKDPIASSWLVYEGGKIDVYVDEGGDNFADGNLTVAAATDGQKWLTLEGDDAFTITNIFGTFTGSLIGFNFFGGSAQANGTGFGALNVRNDGGLADSYFDTDQFDNNAGGTFDVSLDSSYQNIQKGIWPLSGSNTLNAKPIPEPETLALLGLGLLGLGAIRKVRKTA